MVFIMKVREYISKKRAKVIIISILSSLPFIVLLKLFFDSGLFIILFLFFLYFGIYILTNHYVRCPICNSKLGWLLFKGRDILHLSDDVKCCPSCGVSFDEKYSE